MTRPQIDMICDWHPFSAQAKLDDQPLYLRPFGILAEDLEIDFNRKPLYVAVDLLHCCTRRQQGDRLKQEFYWDLPVGDRIQSLLTLSSLHAGDTFSFRFKCAEPRCGQLMELDLPLGHFIDLQQAAIPGDPIAIRHNGQVWRMRRPTGRDQRHWLRHAYADEKTAAQAMVRMLWLSGTEGPVPPPDSIPAEMWTDISRALDTADPLMNFQCPAVCPDCRHRTDYPIDLEAFALKHLQQAQNDLLHGMHCLASQYHWSEAQIFAVPPWRRALYLKKIEMERP